ncbi:putative RNA polymerase sigma factor NccH [Verrucomicrobia bacterium]|nr:putative RNA polymerase sigma factor NccH [Verrucomicrobiota bacterium]
MSVAVEDLEMPSMALEPDDDPALAKRVAAGDQSAVNELYQRHADPLFAFILHSLQGSRPEAEDVWQDTLAAAFRALPSYRGQSRFFSWLCSIARHKIADYYRRRNRTTQPILLIPPEELTQLMDEGPLPDELINQRETCLRVVEALGQMPMDYRQALTARYSDGRSVEEVARLLSKSYKATESLLSRARVALRAALAQQPEMDL